MILQFTSSHFEFFATNQDREYLIDLDEFRYFKRGVRMAIHITRKGQRCRTYSLSSQGLRRIDLAASA